MTLPEAIAVVTGVLSVWFAKKESVWVYPIGIISVLLYVYICVQVKLYADAGINFYYFLVSVYGWYFWLTGGKTRSANSPSHASISALRLRLQTFFILLTATVGMILGWALDQYTDSTVPYWDGFTAAIFCTAMWLMARKHIEHWIYWIIGDLICIPLFFSKGLCLSSIQYIIFTVIAVAGWIAWQKKWRLRRNYA